MPPKEIEHNKHDGNDEKEGKKQEHLEGHNKDDRLCTESKKEKEEVVVVESSAATSTLIQLMHHPPGEEVGTSFSSRKGDEEDKSASLDVPNSASAILHHFSSPQVETDRTINSNYNGGSVANAIAVPTRDGERIARQHSSSTLLKNHTVTFSTCPAYRSSSDGNLHAHHLHHRHHYEENEQFKAVESTESSSTNNSFSSSNGAFPSLQRANSSTPASTDFASRPNYLRSRPPALVRNWSLLHQQGPSSEDGVHSSTHVVPRTLQGEQHLPSELSPGPQLHHTVSILSDTNRDDSQQQQMSTLIGLLSAASLPGHPNWETDPLSPHQYGGELHSALLRMFPVPNEPREVNPMSLTVVSELDGSGEGWCWPDGTGTVKEEDVELVVRSDPLPGGGHVAERDENYLTPLDVKSEEEHKKGLHGKENKRTSVDRSTNSVRSREAVHAMLSSVIERMGTRSYNKLIECLVRLSREFPAVDPNVVIVYNTIIPHSPILGENEGQKAASFLHSATAHQQEFHSSSFLRDEFSTNNTVLSAPSAKIGVARSATATTKATTSKTHEPSLVSLVGSPQLQESSLLRNKKQATTSADFSDNIQKGDTSTATPSNSKLAFLASLSLSNSCDHNAAAASFNAKSLSELIIPPLHYLNNACAVCLEDFNKAPQLLNRSCEELLNNSVSQQCSEGGKEARRQHRDPLVLPVPSPTTVHQHTMWTSTMSPTMDRGQHPQSAKVPPDETNGNPLGEEDLLPKFNTLLQHTSFEKSLVAEANKPIYIRILRCQHAFHCECLDNWVTASFWKEGLSCPLCRNQILTRQFPPPQSIERPPQQGMFPSPTGDGN